MEPRATRLVYEATTTVVFDPDPAPEPEWMLNLGQLALLQDRNHRKRPAPPGPLDFE